jgi:hypothetical protein
MSITITLPAELELLMFQGARVSGKPAEDDALPTGSRIPI